ncbi:MAG: hypothetical protein OEY07_21140, partial [Gammaproteobacteria bacterium]|nr:hypothetical protein [Gammaproteobacteria bacterium]
RQHGMVKLGWTIVLACGMIILPFTLPGVSISGYLALISAYSGLWVHPLAITHNIWMTLTMLVPVLYLLYVDKKTAPDGRLDRDLFWTLLLTLAMVFGVGVLGAVDGAGIYHMAPFAPLFSVLFVILYDRNKDRLPTFMDGFDKQARALYLAVFVAWFASMAFFTSSAQKKVLNYAWDNHSVELRDEVLSIRDFLQGRYQQVLIGYTDHPNHKLTYVRSWLWPVVKGNVVDPVVFAGRQAVGLDLPEATLKRFGQQYYDVIIMPGEGEPYSMDNWHNRKLLVFGEQLPVLFRQNYVVWKTWPHFTLWRAKRHG